MTPPTHGGRRSPRSWRPIARSSSFLLGGGLCLFFYITVIEPLAFHTTSSARRQPLPPTYEALSHTQEAHDQQRHDCLAADVLLPARFPSSPSASSEARPIPLLATNLDYDTDQFLARLMGGWDGVPALHKLVVAGGCDPTVVAAVDAVREEHPDVAVYRQREPLGCAAGWNKALDYMQWHEDVAWAMIFNADIYVPPGALEALGDEVWRAYDADPLLCRGFFNVTAGVFTRHALATLGRFDENMYPAYFEDHDMDLRRNLSLAVLAPNAVRGGVLAPRGAGRGGVQERHLDFPGPDERRNQKGGRERGGPAEGAGLDEPDRTWVPVLPAVRERQVGVRHRAGALPVHPPLERSRKARLVLAVGLGAAVVHPPGGAEGAYTL